MQVGALAFGMVGMGLHKVHTPRDIRVLEHYDTRFGRGSGEARLGSGMDFAPLGSSEKASPQGVAQIALVVEGRPTYWKERGMR